MRKMDRRKLYVTRGEVECCNKIARAFGDETASQEYFLIKSFKQKDEEVLRGD